MTGQTARGRMRFGGGLLVRGKVRHEVNWVMGRWPEVTWKLYEDKGWLWSDFQLVMTGPASLVMRAGKDIQSSLRRMDMEG